MTALPLQKEKKKENNIVSFEIIKKENKHTKLKKDGTIKLIPNNNKETRWVNPIKDKNEIHKIFEYLDSQIESANRADTLFSAYRNELLFAIGINVGLRVSDLIELKWEHIFDKDMETFIDASNKTENKTGKYKNICPNAHMQKYILKYLQNTGVQPKEGEYIFVGSRKDKNGNCSHIKEGIVAKLMKDIQVNCKLCYNVNTHSLRKSYAWHKYMMYVENKDPLALVKVQKDLNHRNSSDTARYLGITREEVIKSSMNLGDYWDL